MQPRMTLILGGARSGKSTHAEKLAAQGNAPVLYVATATAGDSDMAFRIARHRSIRPANWKTIEAPRNVADAIAASGGGLTGTVLVDCITMLVSNIACSTPDIDDMRMIAEVERELEALIALCGKSEAQWIFVSNEVGLGIIPANPLGRVFRDVLGKANQRIAAVAGTVLLMVAGIPIVVKQPR